MSPRICAVIGARNSERYLEILLPHLNEQGIDVFVVDNESDPESLALYDRYRGAPVIGQRNVPHPGHYSLVDILEAKAEVVASLDHEWVVHHDTDEFMEHRRGLGGLRTVIEEADDSGHDVVNFEEFVFVPSPDERDDGGDYRDRIRRYYFFERSKHRLQRAWRRSSGHDPFGSGGHEGHSDATLAPTDHTLRHYPVLDQDHARAKYGSLAFDPADLERGWHDNRIDLTEDQLTLPPPDHPGLRVDDGQGPLSRADPTTRHFWQWEAARSSETPSDAQ